MILVLSNADTYAPEHLGLRHVLIAAGRIVWVGEQQPPSLADLGAEVVDLEGRRLIPGLIDGHAHVTGGGGESGFSTRVPPVPLSVFTSAGVTTVVGLLGTDDTTRDTKSLLAQTRALNEEGITALCHTGGYHLPPVTLTGNVRSDIVHLDPVIGVGELAISDHRSSQPTLDELLRIASEAHVGGLISGKAGIVHLHLGDGERGLELVRRALDVSEIPGRVFNPTHVNRRKRLFDEAIELSTRGCTIDVTAFPVAEGEDAWSAEDAVARYLETGLPGERITVSSDGGGCLPTFDDQGRMQRMEVGRPDTLIETVRRLVQSGIALENVIPAFTSNVAALLQLGRKGHIEPGMDADLIVLDEDTRINDVMALGRWHVKNAQQLVRGEFELEN